MADRIQPSPLESTVSKVGKVALAGAGILGGLYAGFALAENLFYKPGSLFYMCTLNSPLYCAPALTLPILGAIFLPMMLLRTYRWLRRN